LGYPPLSVPLTGFAISKERSVAMDEDRSLLSSPFELELDEIHGGKKNGKPWPARDGPSADVAGNPCVRPAEEISAVAHLAVSVFAVRFAHTLRRGIRFSLPLILTAPFHHLLPLGFSFPFYSFFLRRFFSSSLLSSSLSSLAFRLWDSFSPTRPWIPPLVSLVCVCFLCIASRSSLRFPTL